MVGIENDLVAMAIKRHRLFNLAFASAVIMETRVVGDIHTPIPEFDTLACGNRFGDRCQFDHNHRLFFPGKAMGAGPASGPV